MQRQNKRLGPTQSPVVSATLTRKRKNVRARDAFKWAIWSFMAILLILFDRYFLISSHIVSGIKLYILQCLELLLLAILILSLLYDVVLYVSSYITITATRIKVTDTQKKLLGVQEKASGYVSVLSPSPFGVQLASTPLNSHSQHTHTPPLHYMTPTGIGHSSYHSTPQSDSNTSSRTSTPSSWQISSFGKGSPYDTSGRISNYSTLEKFLSFERDQEYKLQASSPDVSAQSHGSPYLPEFAPAPRRYHLSTISHSLHGGEKDTSLNSETGTGSQALSKLGIKRGDLNNWTDRLRKWLAMRVVCPIAKEIENINSTLTKLGSSDVQIGSVTLATLQQTARTKIHQVPTLNLLVPYLELSTKQDYLSERIKELSKGSYLSAFHWNAGGLWKGQPWEPTLPNDSQIVMHLFCAYLDSQFPPNPQYPADGKAFSSRYFLKSPELPSSKKTDICLYQECNNPPHYKVLLKDKCIDIAQGRNNLFHAIAVFLFCVKSLEKSMLGQVNVENSGINVLWIIQQD